MSFVFLNVALGFHDWLSFLPLFLKALAISLPIVFVIGLVSGFFHLKSISR